MRFNHKVSRTPVNDHWLVKQVICIFRPHGRNVDISTRIGMTVSGVGPRGVDDGRC